MISLEKLLAPVRDDAPCGDDASATGVLFELETAIQGKPETQFSAAEEPEWKTLTSRTIEVAETTKDFRVAGILSASLLRTHGLKGFAEGIQLIRGYVDKYWPTVYPLLDATENNDPSERINALSNLAAPVNTDGDLWKVIAGLRKTPVLLAPRAGRFALEHYLSVKGTVPWPAAAGTPPSEALIEAAIKEADPAGTAATVAIAKELIENLTAIEAAFKANSGPSSFPALEPLRREIKTIVTWLDVAPVTEQVPVTTTTSGSGNATSAGAGTSGPSIGGAVRNREDVVKALDAIIAYYAAVEPSSPVPFLLGRVKRIVPMNFMQLITELTPDAVERIIALTGPVDQSTASPT